jgi:hypothetical protein
VYRGKYDDDGGGVVREKPKKKAQIGEWCFEKIIALPVIHDPPQWT